MVIIHAMNKFAVDINTKCAEMVVTDHQCLPVSWYRGALPMEGSGHTWTKDENKSLKTIDLSGSLKGSQTPTIYLLTLLCNIGNFRCNLFLTSPQLLLPDQLL